MYQIVVQGKKVKKNQVTGMHLMVGFLLTAIGFFTWLVPNSVKQETFAFLNYVGLLYGFLGLAIIIICIFFNKKVIQTQNNLVLRWIEMVALLTVFIYSIYQKWHLPSAYAAAGLISVLLAYFWETSAKKSSIIAFEDDIITLPKFSKRSSIAWEDLNKVLLRYNTLTIDFKNNKLIQLDIDKIANISINPNDFEAYCKIQIKAKEHLYKKEW
jgi:hypothetical protein